MRSIAWMSEKGGSGKTTSAVNTAAAFARMRKRTLLIDADPQGNASAVLLGGREPEGPNLFHVLTDSAGAGDAIHTTAWDRLDVIPADSRLADANVSLAAVVGRERRLQLAMRDVEGDYEFVVIDTSPQRTLVNTNVLNYVREVMCTVEPGVFSLTGLVKLRGSVAEVVKYLDN